MKIYIILTSFLILTSLSLPLIINTAYQPKPDNDSIFQSADVQEQERTVSVLLAESETVEEIQLREYIIGVVAGEMPASFSDEALKAQAVASYTYAKYIFEHSSEKNSYITDSPDTHQAYIDNEAQKEKWGESYEVFREKIENAVDSVFGEYISYNNKTALTVFHASSAGYTLSAEEVWGKPLPYLISVSAPTDKTTDTEISFTANDFRKCFEEKGEALFKDSAINKWAAIVKKDNNGYIKELKVGNKSFLASEVKEILNLSGINFKAKLEGENFVFTVTGKGHGVGLSQYSAEYMALQGKNYKEILSHFYPGTHLEKE